MIQDKSTALKYLRRHGEPEAQGLSPLLQKYGHVIVIPAYGEDDSLLETLESVPQGPLGTILKIVVVNGRADSPPPVHERNLKHLSRLSKLSDLILIDRASEKNHLPSGQGVGLARKIGCDVALGLFLSEGIRSPWIHCTDADTLLPPDYFHRSPPFHDEKISALIYPFHHLCEEEPETAEAMRLYEISLRYYVLGLSLSSSPYAYPSLGSSLAIHAEAYAQIGGFPRRSAGEDFYLLNKAAKVGRIVLAAGEPLMIRGRLSNRVPFGTGRALHKILEDNLSGRPFRLYHPRCFDYLAAWLKALKAWALDEDGGTITDWLRASCRTFPKLDPVFLEGILNSLGAFSSLEKKLPPSSRPEVRLRHAHTWWDAFRTLKFIHALREARYASLPFPEALSLADFLDAGAYLPEKNWEGLRLHLARAEGEVLREARGLVQ